MASAVELAICTENFHGSPFIQNIFLIQHVCNLIIFYIHSNYSIAK
jgi:hypothetical protein